MLLTYSILKKSKIKHKINTTIFYFVLLSRIDTFHNPDVRVHAHLIEFGMFYDGQCIRDLHSYTVAYILYFSSNIAYTLAITY